MFDCLTGRPNYSDCDYPIFSDHITHTSLSLPCAPFVTPFRGTLSQATHISHPALSAVSAAYCFPPATCHLPSAVNSRLVIPVPTIVNIAVLACSQAAAPKLLLLLLSLLLLLLFLATSEATQAAPMHSGIQDSRHLIYTKPRPHHDICQRCHADSHT